MDNTQMGDHLGIIIFSSVLPVADPGFPMGEHEPRRRDVDSRGCYVS